MRVILKRDSVLPGFGLTLGTTVLYLSLIVLIPLASVFLKTATLSWSQFWDTVTAPRALAAYRLSFGAGAIAATINAVFGLLVAWVLVRYEFPGRRFVDGLVDLPFALPTAMAGLALTSVYAENGWIGAPLMAMGLKVAFTELGVVVALTFVGLPFAVRTVQPVLADLEAETEEVAASLGASRLQTFLRVIFPALLPSVIAGFTLAFARGVGEYGSVIFISGNMPLRTEIAPLVIVTKLEQFDYAGATAIAVVMLLASLVLLLALNLVQRWSNRFAVTA